MIQYTLNNRQVLYLSDNMWNSFMLRLINTIRIIMHTLLKILRIKPYNFRRNCKHHACLTTGWQCVISVRGLTAGPVTLTSYTQLTTVTSCEERINHTGRGISDQHGVWRYCLCLFSSMWSTKCHKIIKTLVFWSAYCFYFIFSSHDKRGKEDES